MWIKEKQKKPLPNGKHIDMCKKAEYKAYLKKQEANACLRNSNLEIREHVCLKIHLKCKSISLQIFC